MERTETPDEAQHELAELQVRAYGPDADIQDDPAALARLIELEAALADGAATTVAVLVEQFAGADAATDVAGADDVAAPSAETESPAPPSVPPARRRILMAASRHPWLAIGAGAAIVGAAFGTAWLLETHPDAILERTARSPDAQVRRLMQDAEFLEIDPSTLESFERFRGVEPWFAVDRYGNPCLIVIERSTDTMLDAACTPLEAELTTDIEAWPALSHDFAEGLPDGSVIRFHLRDHTVEAFIHRASEGS